MNNNNISISHLMLYLAWLTSIIATFGSLYMSEFLGFIPCELCWYQRIFMYPLIIILGIAVFKNDISVKKYVLPLSIIGGSISLMHYLQQKIPSFSGIKSCARGVPCTTEYINWFGFVTIPFMALTAFTLITVFMFIAKKK